ncbi:MAG TPA: hypothetical protein VHU84_05025, partial [Lacipirellulaceae bacterium]|nr:hypothetical protein [Lacipirellulaceae bacterium]
ERLAATRANVVARGGQSWQTGWFRALTLRHDKLPPRPSEQCSATAAPAAPSRKATNRWRWWQVKMRFATTNKMVAGRPTARLRGYFFA